MADLEILNLSYNKISPDGLNYFCRTIIKNGNL